MAKALVWFIPNTSQAGALVKEISTKDIFLKWSISTYDSAAKRAIYWFISLAQGRLLLSLRPSICWSRRTCYSHLIFSVPFNFGEPVGLLGLARVDFWKGGREEYILVRCKIIKFTSPNFFFIMLSRDRAAP